MVLAGKEYGTGSSRDWAAKGPRLLGVRAVIAESFERIHRSQPGRHGHPAARVRGRRERREPRPHRPRDLSTSRAWPRAWRAASPTAATVDGARPTAPTAAAIELPRPRPARHAAGGRVLPPRRHPAVRAAPAARRALSLAARASERPAPASGGRRDSAPAGGERVDRRRRTKKPRAVEGARAGGGEGADETGFAQPWRRAQLPIGPSSILTLQIPGRIPRPAARGGHAASS